MAGPDSVGSAPAPPLLQALAETGVIGSTVAQLSQRTGVHRESVKLGLEILGRDGRAVRMGRGLWIHADYADLSALEGFAGPLWYSEEFARETGISLQSYSGPITSSLNDTLPVHRWWPYVQGFSAKFVRHRILSAELQHPAKILDPFCGSGTSLVESRSMGDHAIGWEILPPAALAARVKTGFEMDPEKLARAGGRLLDRAGRCSPGPRPFLRETRRQFSTRALSKLLRLRSVLPQEGDPIANGLRIAFDRILIPSSKLRRSPCLGYRPSCGPPAQDPYEGFRAAIAAMQEDLHTLAPDRTSWGPPAVVQTGDSRLLSLPSESVDLAITSPPYVNGMDYVMNYKLDLAWLGYAQSYSDLALLRQRMIACDNLPRAEGSQYLSMDRMPDAWLSNILRQIESNVRRKGTYRRHDVHGIVKRYFLDLAPVLRNVFRALVPGGTFSLVVGDSLLAGTYVPGDLVLARMGTKAGFTIQSVEVARTRRSGQRRKFVLRESIVTLRKKGRSSPS